MTSLIPIFACPNSRIYWPSCLKAELIRKRQIAFLALSVEFITTSPFVKSGLQYPKTTEQIAVSCSDSIIAKEVGQWCVCVYQEVCVYKEVEFNSCPVEEILINLSRYDS